jgi:hypothetical protein
MKIEHHSVAGCNLFCASREMYVLERILMQKQPVGAAAPRGTAVEAGIAMGLLDPDAKVEDCIAHAYKIFDGLTALSGDPRREDQRKLLEGMVPIGLEELRPYGVPTQTQGQIEWQAEGLAYPFLGFFDFYWEQHGILIDLKTTEKLHTKIQLPHARQVALYTGAISDNLDGRVSYVTPRKSATYKVENAREHRAALVQIAHKIENFLALSDDPQFYVDITAPDFSSFYWANPAARQAGYECWGF